MKSTIFKKVLNEELIEVHKSVPETIKCLQAQCGGSHDSIPNDMGIFFDCSKNGKISVNSFFKHRRGLRYLNIYYVGGNVFSRDNKTYVKITSVYKKTDIVLQILLIVLLIILAPIYIFLKSYVEGIFIVPAFIAASIIFIFVIIDSIHTTILRQKCGIEIIKIMENEIRKRLQNLERWND